MERIAAEQRTTLYISSLSWLEFIHTITRQRFRDVAGDEIKRRFRLDRWAEPSIRQTYTAYMVDGFSVLLN